MLIEVSVTMPRGICSVCLMLPACWLSVFTFRSLPKWIMQSSTLGGNRNSSSHQRTAGNQCTTAGCACQCVQAHARTVHVPLLVCAWDVNFMSVCVCTHVSLGVCLCVYASSVPSLLSALLLCMYACVALLPVCLSACAPLNWRSSLADPASYTLRQLEHWIIWAVSGPVSLWALLYVHCQHGRKESVFASTAVMPWLHALQTKHSPT